MSDVVELPFLVLEHWTWFMSSVAERLASALGREDDDEWPWEAARR